MALYSCPGFFVYREMEIQENFVNKVAQSGLVTLDPAAFYPQGERVIYDIADNLFQGLILREKDFREFVKEHDWSQYQDKYVGIICSADAIVPAWAYMLLANRMAPYAKDVVFGDKEALETILFAKAIAGLDAEQYRDQRLVVKGCGDVEVPVSAYVALAEKLTPVVKSLMFGEPCSTVPLYKRKD